MIPESNKFVRGRGIINVPLYDICMDSAALAKGNFMEIGVYKAQTFEHIYNKAMLFNREVVAVDSFCGMPEPTHPGDEFYHKGKFDTGGPGWFGDKFPESIVIVGFVPEILSSIPDSEYAFIHVDIDHYETSYHALKWSWEHLSFRGIMIAHDFYEGRENQASGAISKWLSEVDVTPIGHIDSSIVFKKFTQKEF